MSLFHKIGGKIDRGGFDRSIDRWFCCQLRIALSLFSQPFRLADITGQKRFNHVSQ
jgi:hypothetical protein